MSGDSISRYTAQDPRLTLPCAIISTVVSSRFAKWTGPSAVPPVLIALPRGRSEPRYADVPAPIFVCIPTSAVLPRIDSIRSST